MTKRYQRGNQNPYMSFFNIQILITPLVSVGHFVVCPSSIYRFWLPLMVKRYQRGNQNPYIEEEQTTQWSKDTKGVIRICILKLPLWYLLTIALSVLLQYTDSNYPFGIFWSLCCLFFFNIQILITPLVSFGHCVVCSSSIYRFW
jgi:hypothetical protein